MLTYKERPIGIASDFSMETKKARRFWSRIMKILRDHRGQHRLLYPAKLSITIDRQSKIVHDGTRFNQYLATNPNLHKVLEGKFHPNKVGYIKKKYRQ